MYEGPEGLPQKVLEESELGFYEKRMLELSGGIPNILEYVEQMLVKDDPGRSSRSSWLVRRAGDGEIITRNTA